MALHTYFLYMWFYRCLRLDVQQRLMEFHTFTVLMVARAAICHQQDYTQRPDTTPLCEHD